MSLDTGKTIPFSIPEINHGFQEASGLMKLTNKGFELEFEVKDAILGVMKSGIKNVVIPYSELESVEYKKGWFSSKIILNATSMRVFENVPGTDVATCTIKVKRKHRDEARSLASHARLQLSEYKLDQMDKSHD